MDEITTSEALQIINARDEREKKVPFHIEFYTKSGELRYLKSCIPIGSKLNLNQNMLINIRSKHNSILHDTHVRISLIKSINGKRLIP